MYEEFPALTIRHRCFLHSSFKDGPDKCRDGERETERQRKRDREREREREKIRKVSEKLAT